MLRDPAILEKRLLSQLIQLSVSPMPDNWFSALKVRSLDDGNMGSIRLYPNGVVDEMAVFGKQAGEIEFLDQDGVVVLVSLYLDQNGQLFEMEVWKTDFSPVLKWPD